MTDRSVTPDSALVDVLEQSQQLGFLGARPIDEVIEHARAFVRAVRGIDDGARVIDIGSGGGVPGLVLAHDLPALHLELIDRRAKRTDFLERVVRRLGWNDRVAVTCADVDDVGRMRPGATDIVVARGFGPPDVTISVASRLVRAGGHVIISEPPEGDRWDPRRLDELGVVRISPLGGAVVVFRVGTPPAAHD